MPHHGIRDRWRAVGEPEAVACTSQGTAGWQQTTGRMSNDCPATSGWPVTGGQAVPSCRRNSAPGGPIMMASNTIRTFDRPLQCRAVILPAGNGRESYEER